ncbi:hypothetical protein IF1G_07914 [Cordyceps javanica]|uniref:Uncharacterized protein n=1 Tax=Cordyceps javanica TaxID=43265 RepID=A0A545UV56_9HYPO|nr:hypothetical protein IF1G_07914 [Cordyceps javanica]
MTLCLDMQGRSSTSVGSALVAASFRWASTQNPSLASLSDLQPEAFRIKCCMRQRAGHTMKKAVRGYYAPNSCASPRYNFTSTAILSSRSFRTEAGSHPIWALSALGRGAKFFHKSESYL